MKIIAGTCCLPAGKAALDAAVNYFLCSSLRFKGGGFHHSAAPLGAVAGVYIYMLAPQAFGAMVCVAVAFHLPAAIFAHKVLFCFYKLFHEMTNISPRLRKKPSVVKSERMADGKSPVGMGRISARRRTSPRSSRREPLKVLCFA